MYKIFNNVWWQVFDAEVLVALEEGEARVALEAGAGAARWHELAARHPAPPDVLAERDDWRPAPGDRSLNTYKQVLMCTHIMQ